MFKSVKLKSVICVGGVVSGLVIDEDGTFYLIAGSNVTAFDSTGFLKWSKNLGQVTMPGLALDNRGNIIIPVKDNRLVILNKTTGKYEYKQYENIDHRHDHF